LDIFGEHKYLHNTENSIMDTHDDIDTTSTDNRLDAQRSIIRQALNQIANDVGMMLRDEGLRFPVYITVRNSGDSLATIATTLDPTDTEWSRASVIVCEVIEKRIGGGKLRGRELPCAVANAAPISVAEVAPG
jgi:hypothetical protein